MSTDSQCSVIQLSPHPSNEKYNLPFNDDTVMKQLQNRSYTDRDANSGTNYSLTLSFPVSKFKPGPWFIPVHLQQEKKSWRFGWKLAEAG